VRRKTIERQTRIETGVSLVEMLVATLVLTLVGSVALVTFRAARHSQTVADARVELQQSLRVGLDRIITDLGAAGLAVHPDDRSLTPDEAIEAAWGGAVIFRGDMDGYASRSSVPEESLGGTAPYLNVTTGNDEIVGYVLGRSDGSSPETIEFQADVRGVPRDGEIENVSIGGVAMAHGAPPYTLYRLSVRPDSSRTSRTPVADNIRSLRLTYFDGAGSIVDPPGGGDEPLARQTRASIRRIRIELEGLTREGDPRWRDHNDPNPRTRGHRKLRLSVDVVPRNLGLVGRADTVPGVL